MTAFEHRSMGRRSLRAALLIAALGAGSVLAADDNPRVRLQTTLGPIDVELFEAEAPKTVANFLKLVDQDFYDGLIFHRVIPGFMVQGGGFDVEMAQKKTREPIGNEAQNGLKNTVGTLAMARTSDPHSATAQFFINVADNAFLDFTSATRQGFGYAVFGRVTEGMDVVKRIVAVPTGNRGPHQNVPLKPVVIKSVRVVATP